MAGSMTVYCVLTYRLSLRVSCDGARPDTTWGYKARCRRSGQTAWFGKSGVQYSLLEEWCCGINASEYSGRDDSLPA